MRKLDSLRTWLLRAVPMLSATPERLHVTSEPGRIVCVQGASLSYRIEYPITVRVEDLAASSDQIIVPLLAWIAEHEPSQLGTDAPGLSFEMFPLDNHMADIEFTIPVVERAVVEETDDGGWQVTSAPELPLPMAFDGANPPARLWQLWGTRTMAEPETKIIVAHPDHLP